MARPFHDLFLADHLSISCGPRIVWASLVSFSILLAEAPFVFSRMIQCRFRLLILTHRKKMRAPASHVVDAIFEDIAKAQRATSQLSGMKPTSCKCWPGFRKTIQLRLMYFSFCIAHLSSSSIVMLLLVTLLQHDLGQTMLVCCSPRLLT